jgi:cytochrome c oxidase subunit 2
MIADCHAPSVRDGRGYVRRGRAGIALVAAGFLSGCGSPNATFSPAGAEARHITGLWWTFFFVCAAVFAAVAVILVIAIWRARPGARPPPSDGSSLPRVGETGLRRAVLGATGLTVIALFGLLLADFSVGRELRAPSRADALTIKITGHQWWWYIEYNDATSSAIIQTANELHLPVGRPVQLVMQSADVIHSFWIPRLHGKMDLIPGHTTRLWLQPEQVGTYRGQCAEFCGYQHAHMGLTAVVESPEDFAKWQESQRAEPPPPATDSQRRGQQVFLTSSCVLCHSISGTIAGSRVGPPLTHLASQQTLAAGTVPNNRGYLAGWILDPQSLKPGARMPQNLLSADDLQALLDYLQSLK